jgi:hypothetical protein
MDEYFLFLDESKSIGPLAYFCLAGYIICKDEYTRDLIPKVNALKQSVFSKTDVILHEKDIRDATGDFRRLSDKAVRETFWSGIHAVFNESDVHVVGAGVSRDISATIYRSEHLNSDYNIALQIILENYVCFLERSDAKGNVVIESSNETADTKLRNLFHAIVSDGTLFLSRNAFQRYLTTIAFYIKQDNHIGLQMADFIPNAINRKISGLKPKPYSTINIIEEKLYDGHLGMKSRFGFKVVE